MIAQNADRLFPKWQEWLLTDLHDQVSRLVLNHRIHQSLMEILGGFKSFRKETIQSSRWMSINYYESACLSVRRLSDKDTKTRSMRSFLLDMQKNAIVFKQADWAKHNPTYRPGPQSDDVVIAGVKETIEEELRLMDQHSNSTKIFVDKFLAHLDHNRTVEQIVTLEPLDDAVHHLHYTYLKYAFLIAGVPCNLREPDPYHLVPIRPEQLRLEFAKMLCGIFDEPPAMAVLRAKGKHSDLQEAPTDTDQS